MKDRNRTKTLATDKQAIAGVRKNLQGMSVLHLAGQTFTPASVEQHIQARVDLATRIVAAEAAWHQVVSEYRAIDRPTDVILRDLRRLVVGAFGDGSPKLADFGFVPPKQMQWTEEKKRTAVARRAATRLARGTRGPKAKLRIKGVVEETSPATERVPGQTDTT
jgi:hypothetical protein